MRKILTTTLGKKFINLLMVNGKKNKAARLLLETLTLLDKNAAHILTTAIKNVKPVLEVRSIRLRGANYQVPIPLMENRRTSLAIKWIIESAKKEKRTIYEK
jgi:small subunit ribosomal protein S7